MRKVKSKYLTPEHPSYGCEQAWFMFAVKNHRGPGFCRLLLVEAKSHAAVAFLERVSALGEEEAGPSRVSPTCELMSVHRGCDVGIRSDLLEEVALGDFVLDIVERERVDRDPLAFQALQEALGAPAPAVPAAPPPKGGEADLKRENAISALTGLGFSRPVALLRLKPLEGRLHSMGLDEILRATLAEAS